MKCITQGCLNVTVPQVDALRGLHANVAFMVVTSLLVDPNMLNNNCTSGFGPGKLFLLTPHFLLFPSTLFTSPNVLSLNWAATGETQSA